MAQRYTHEITKSVKNPEFVFFWGNPPGQIAPGCLSNFYPAEFTYCGIVFPTSEHYMMYMKACMAGDEEAKVKVFEDERPGVAKMVGRSVKNFNQDLWTEYSHDIMVPGLIAKFTQNPKLEEYLLSTGDKILVEASPSDKIWGIGMAANDPHINNPAMWNGENRLGYVLMFVRDYIRTMRLLNA